MTLSISFYLAITAITVTSFTCSTSPFQTFFDSLNSSSMSSESITRRWRRYFSCNHHPLEHKEEEEEQEEEGVEPRDFPLMQRRTGMEERSVPPLSTAQTPDHLKTSHQFRFLASTFRFLLPTLSCRRHRKRRRRRSMARLPGTLNSTVNCLSIRFRSPILLLFLLLLLRLPHSTESTANRRKQRTLRPCENIKRSLPQLTLLCRERM